MGTHVGGGNGGGLVRPPQVGKGKHGDLLVPQLRKAWKTNDDAGNGSAGV